MGEQRTGIPRASGLSCTLDATKEHPERYATIIGGAAPLPLNNVQARALFRIMLSHLAQIAGDELHQESLLEQGDLIQLLNFSMDLLGSWSDHDLQDRQVLKEALEQYSLASDMQARSYGSCYQPQGNTFREFAEPENSSNEMTNKGLIAKGDLP